MPPRRAQRPITQIKRTGKMDVEYTLFEDEEIINKIKSVENDIPIQLDRAKSASSNRRETKNKEESFKNDMKDIKSIIGAQLQRIKLEKRRNKVLFEKLKHDQIEKRKENSNKTSQMKSSFAIEATQLKNNLQMLIMRRDNNANIAAQENQLRREISEAQQTYQTEKKQQSQLMSTALDDYYQLHQKHERELIDSIQSETLKNRGMTANSLENTVVEMMREIDQEKNKLAAEVKKAKYIVEKNAQLTEKNRYLQMSKDLLQKECDSLFDQLSKYDTTIRTLVEELKEKDQKITLEFARPDIIEEPEERSIDPESHVADPSPDFIDDREHKLHKFFDETVYTLCDSIVYILSIVDEKHADEYIHFHNVFSSPEERQKELRFLISKLGNTSFDLMVNQMITPLGFDDIEGPDEEFTQKELIDPQNRAIFEFSQPIKTNEFPSLISTHFFQ